MKFLFDLGGVFFDWNPKYFFKNIFKSKDDLDFFLINVCNQEWNLQQDSGRPTAEAEKELILKFSKYANEIKMYYPNHRKMIKGVFQESIDVLYDLKKQFIECYVLSNWSAETFEGMIEDYPFLKKFDGIVLSGEEKVIKPDERIYQIAINKYNLIPSETIFIDDNLDNIIVAKKLGLNTIHFINPNTIRKEIYKFLI